MSLGTDRRNSVQERSVRSVYGCTLYGHQGQGKQGADQVKCRVAQRPNV